MKISHVLQEADVDAATQKLNREYNQKLKQVPAVLKGVKADVTKAMAQLKARGADVYAKEAPALITDVTNKVIDFADPKNNEPPFTGNPDDSKALDAYITGAIKAKYQETIYKTVNRGNKGAGTAADAAAGAQPKPNDPAATASGQQSAQSSETPGMQATTNTDTTKVAKGTIFSIKTSGGSEEMYRWEGGSWSKLSANGKWQSGQIKNDLGFKLYLSAVKQGTAMSPIPNDPNAGAAYIDPNTGKKVDPDAPATPAPAAQAQAAQAQAAQDDATDEPADDAQAQGNTIPADVQQQLDALTPAEKEELKKALAA